MGTLRNVRLGVVILLLTGVLGAPAGVSPAGVDVGSAATITWSVQLRTLEDGRTYYINAPSCAPADATECLAFLGRARDVVVWWHGAGGHEDLETATRWLTSLHSWGRDTLFVFAMSQGGTRVFDAGVCCTRAPVDDVGYLVRVVDDVASRWSVDRRRVGAAGFSNGGIMAERLACERPDVVAAASSLAGTFAGTCDVARTHVAQWHGALDKPVPLNGGTTWVAGAERTFPPAASLGQRMLSGSTFVLQVRPGVGHGLPWADYRESVRWLLVTIQAG